MGGLEGRKRVDFLFYTPKGVTGDRGRAGAGRTIWRDGSTTIRSVRLANLFAESRLRGMIGPAMSGSSVMRSSAH
jgi:hypothetical protein